MNYNVCSALFCFHSPGMLLFVVAKSNPDWASKKQPIIQTHAIKNLINFSSNQCYLQDF